jgi:hypothetical protein
VSLISSWREDVIHVRKNMDTPIGPKLANTPVEGNMIIPSVKILSQLAFSNTRRRKLSNKKVYLQETESRTFSKHPNNTAGKLLTAAPITSGNVSTGKLSLVNTLFCFQVGAGASIPRESCGLELLWDGVYTWGSSIPGEGEDPPKALFMDGRGVPLRRSGVFSDIISDAGEPTCNIDPESGEMGRRRALLFFGVLEAGESTGVGVGASGHKQGLSRHRSWDGGRECCSGSATGRCPTTVGDAEVLSDTGVVDRCGYGDIEMGSLGECWTTVGVRAPSEYELAPNSYSWRRSERPDGLNSAVRGVDAPLRGGEAREGASEDKDGEEEENDGEK